MRQSLRINQYIFQSTHPVRGATDAIRHVGALDVISIHAPREGCDLDVNYIINYANISIHAPREGCDLPSLGWFGYWLVISIHAPREGCDSKTFAKSTPSLNFNPRTP